MGRTYKHQDTYDYLHDNKRLSLDRLRKLLHYFDRVNFFDSMEKIKYRQVKDFKRGGVARIKLRKYKN